MYRTLLYLTLLATLAACATSPTGRRQLMLVSDDTVSQMGVTAFQQLKQKTPATTDQRQNGYVQCVAAAITRQVPTMPWAQRVPGSWEVVTFESKDVNAFALPGGKIGVYTGLLKVANTEDQLAAVVGHEVSHVLAGHSAERYSDQQVASYGSVLGQAVTGIDGQVFGAAANAFFILPFSRSHETEADILGLDLMAKAGFDPRQAITLWQNMGKASNGQKPPEMLSTHPSDSTRIRNLTERLGTAMPLYEQARAQGRKPNCT